MNLHKIISISLIFSALFFSLSAEDLLKEPWGKDAFLTKSPEKLQGSSSNPLAIAAQALISFHQNYISPLDAPRSHFKPSSSQYMQEAIKRYGFFEGFILGCDRLLRENDDKWIYPPFQNGPLKHDPIP